MTERFSSEAVETLRVRLALREVQGEGTRSRTRPLRKAALGFFASVTVALTLVLALSAQYHREPHFRALGLRGTISE